MASTSPALSASTSATLAARANHAHALRVQLQKAYEAVCERVLEMAKEYTVEVDYVPGDLAEHMGSNDNLLDMADCVTLLRGRMVRRGGKEHYAYMSDSDKPRPDDSVLAALYDEVWDLEGNMRAKDLLDCPSCNGCRLIQ